MTRPFEGSDPDRAGTHAPSAESELTFVETSAAKARPSHAVAKAFLSGVGPTGEELRLLQTKLRALDEEKRLQCFGIVSSSAGEGKSTLALGLAALFAQDRGVILIECDIRKPELESSLGIARHPGLTEWLEATRADVPVRKVVPFGFSLLSAGESKPTRPALLGGVRMRRLMDAARRHFDVVILDCAPLLSVADSVMLQDMVDGFLLVVRSRACPRETVQRAVSNLKPGRIRGVVFNDHSELIPGYESYGTSGYGHR